MVAMCWEKRGKRRVQLFGKVKGLSSCTCRESEDVHKVCAPCDVQCHRTASEQTGRFHEIVFRRVNNCHLHGRGVHLAGSRQGCGPLLPAVTIQMTGSHIQTPLTSTNLSTNSHVG